MNILKSLTQDYLDISLKPTLETTVRIVDRPGRWMKTNELESLVTDLRKIASASLGPADLDYGVLGGDRGRLDDAVITLVKDNDLPPASPSITMRVRG